MLHAPEQPGLDVRAAWSAAVDQYLRPQTPLALAFSDFRWWQECCGAIAILLADVPMGWHLVASVLLCIMDELQQVPPVEAVSDHLWPA